MKRLLARMIGLGLVVAAIHLVRVTLPAKHHFVFKATGVAVVTRSDINKLATAYGITGAVGGVGLALLVLGVGKTKH